MLPSLNQRHVSGGVDTLNSKRNFQVIQSEVTGAKHMKRPSQNCVVDIERKKVPQFSYKYKRNNFSNRVRASEMNLLAHSKTVD